MSIQKGFKVVRGNKFKRFNAFVSVQLRVNQMHKRRDNLAVIHDFNGCSSIKDTTFRLTSIEWLDSDVVKSGKADITLPREAAESLRDLLIELYPIQEEVFNEH